MTSPAGRRIRGFGRSDIGRVRERNEDAFALGDLDHGTLWPGDDEIVSEGARGIFAVVCDGMGGAAGGDVASELAVETTWRELKQGQATDDPEIAARILRRAVRLANQRVHGESRREPGLRGMGTTLSGCFVAGDCLVSAQIGDSRVYVLRRGNLVQVTRDQTVGQALRVAGRITEEEANYLAGGGTILQALGVAPDVEPSLSLCSLRRGDRVLLCSDGLTNQLGESTIATILGDRRGLDQLTQALIDGACAVGGYDNITAVVLDVEGDALPPPVDDPADRPRFVEFDPREEGPRALTSTSNVARRLAARAGLGPDPGPPIVPATGAFRRPKRRPAAVVADAQP
ncbi:MAG TPA: protein phosphatase 2C domain-containing protein, partial [Kofleriaceae bacterium]|nr:protein phosphatase 2C domain-containing protein [Kofleriaceae bacterium]